MAWRARTSPPHSVSGESSSFAQLRSVSILRSSSSMFAARRNAFTLVVATLVGCSKSAPGPRHPGEEYLKSIEVEGNKTLKDKTLVTGLSLRRTQAHGRAPDPYLVSVDEDRIRGDYLRRGFLEVDVRSR